MQYDEVVFGLIPSSASNIGSGYTRSALVSEVKITAIPEYECLKCCDLTRTIDGRSATQVEVD